MDLDEQLENIFAKLDDIKLTTVNGRITEVIGTLIKAVVPQVKIGEVCLVIREGYEPLQCEVVGFTRDEVLLSPLGEMHGIGPSCEVIATRLPLGIKVGNNLLGRVVNGLGEPLDEETKGPLVLDEYVPVIRAPQIPSNVNVSTSLSKWACVRLMPRLPLVSDSVWVCLRRLVVVNPLYWA